MARTKRQRRQKGTGSVRQKGAGWQSRIAVTPGQPPILKQWDHEPTPAELLAWAVEERQRHAGRITAPGSLAEDVQTYLGLTTALVSHSKVAKRLGFWLDALGRDRHRHSVTTQDVDRVIQHWLTTPILRKPGEPGRECPTGLGPDAVRSRCNALHMLYVKLDGTDLKSPVRAASKPRSAPWQRRGRDYAVIARILATMTPWRRNPLSKLGIPQVSLAPIRAAVLAYTGLPPALVRQLTPADLDLDGATIRVPERKKGKGVESRILPLLPQAVEAFRTFHQHNAYGGSIATYQATARAFKRAASRIGIDPATIRLYDLRHSFGEETYRASKGDLATVGRFLMHGKSSRETARYAMGANDEVNRMAAAALAESVAKRLAVQEPAGEPARVGRPPAGPVSGHYGPSKPGKTAQKRTARTARPDLRIVAIS